MNNASPDPGRAPQTASPLQSLSSESILAQLERIVSSPEFTTSQQLCRFLTYIVEQTLLGRSEDLKAYTIALDVFDRGTDFNPQFDSVVRVSARRLRRALQHYYLTEGSRDPIRIEVPKGSYVPTFQEHHPTPAQTASQPAQQQFRPVLAVVALANLCQDESCRYLADGLTEEMLIALTRFSELPVMGALSRDRLRQDQLGPLEIGARYGVRFVLDGSVRSQQGHIRIGFRLIDTTTGIHRWAETYEAQPNGKNLFDIEQDISLKVLGTTTDVHGVIHKTLVQELRNTAPLNLSVHQAMLKFYHYLRTASAESYTDARSALEKTVQTNHDSALARAALGGMYVDEYMLFNGSRDQLDRALELVERAYRQTPHDYMVQFIRAYVYFHTRSADTFEEALELAVQTNPYISTNGELALWCAFAGKLERAMALFERAKQLNPHIPGYYHLTPFLAHAYRAEYEQALSEAKNIRMPAFFVDPVARVVALGYLKRQAEAGAVVAELLQLVPAFEERGREMIQRFWHYEQPIEFLIEGLQKVGMAIV